MWFLFLMTLTVTMYAAGWLIGRSDSDGEDKNFRVCVVLVVGNVTGALGNLLLFGAPVWGVVFNVMLAGYFAYKAWDYWKRRKKKRPSRVLGLVRDLGHRLKVVPV